MNPGWRKAALERLRLQSGLQDLAVLEEPGGTDAAFFRGNAYRVTQLAPGNGHLSRLGQVPATVYLAPEESRPAGAEELRRLYPHLADKSLLVIRLAEDCAPEDCVAAGYAVYDRVPEHRLWVLAKTGCVDVIVPIFNAFESVAACIQSVLAQTSGIPYRLILIDDASTDPRMGPFLASLSDDRVLLLRNETNLGFVKTANRGLAASVENDVVLLNSDTVVTRHWLVRLSQAAYRRTDIGGANPLSNRASIYSIEELSGLRGEDIQNVGRLISGFPPHLAHEIPTAVGFCLFLKRKTVREVGWLDEIFGRGYGEENDFCMRAREKGYRMVLAPNAFVYHTGHVSMREAGVLPPGVDGIEAHEEILARRYPHYRALVHRYLAERHMDNVRGYTVARVGPEVLAGFRKRLLFFLHNPVDDAAMPGGTEFHVKDLVSRLKLRHVCCVAYVRDQCLFLEEHLDEMKSVYVFPLPKPLRPLALRSSAFYDLILRVLREFRIDLVHVHHVMNATLDIFYAAKYLNLPVFLTLHDYYLLSPDHTLSYKFRRGGYREEAEPTPAHFQALLGWGGVNLQNWRLEISRALRLADEIFAPSQTALDEVRKVYSRTANIRVIPHGSPFLPAAPGGKTPFSVCFTGYTHAKHKGYPLLRKVIAALLKAGVPVHLLGTEPGYWKGFLKRRNFHVHGLYARGEAVEKLRAIAPSLVILLPTWKETFSYTLSESWLAGIPVLAAPLGAISERISKHGGGILAADFHPRSVVRAVLDLARSPEELRKLQASVAAIPHQTIDGNVDAYEEIYRTYFRFSADEAPDSEPSGRDGLRGQGLETYWDYARNGRLRAPFSLREAAAVWTRPLNRLLGKLSGPVRKKPRPASPPLDIDPPVARIRPYFKIKRRPLFICGSPRTGTTVLSRVLDSHPSISMTMELGLVNLWHEVEHKMTVVSKGPRDPFEFPERTHELIRENLSKAMLKSREEIHGWRKPQAVYVGDKYPPMIFYLDWLRRKFPEAKFILTLREREAALNSMCKRMPGVPRKAHEKTYDRAAKIVEAERSSPDVLIVRLEDLRRNKIDTFQRVAEFLELEPCFDLSLVQSEAALQESPA